jgi:hypothetical protein
LRSDAVGLRSRRFLPGSIRRGRAGCHFSRGEETENERPMVNVESLDPWFAAPRRFA